MDKALEAYFMYFFARLGVKHVMRCVPARPFAGSGASADALPGYAGHALRARPPFSAHVLVQRICITRSSTSMAAAHTAMEMNPHR